jgi:hypothetical protein
MADWKDSDPSAVKAAMTILGPKAKIPDMLPSIDKASDKSHAAWDEFEAVRKRLKEVWDKVGEMDKNFRAAWEAQKDEINKENFGLDDPKKDKDKIAAARKPFVKHVDGVLQDAQKISDGLKKVDAAVKIIMDAR